MQPLLSEADYDAALKEIERLWEAPIGSRRADQLERLVALVEAYEAKHWPIES